MDKNLGGNPEFHGYPLSHWPEVTTKDKAKDLIRNQEISSAYIYTVLYYMSLGCILSKIIGAIRMIKIGSNVTIG